VPANALLVGLQELYVSVIELSALNIYDASCMEVQYPLLSGSALNDGRLRILSKFDVRDGGSFIQHELLTPQRQRAIISLLTELVTFGRRSEGFPKAASALPDIIVWCAQGMRPQATGERPMKRCIRHAMDSKCESIIFSNGCIFECYGDDVGIILYHCIPVSFKDAAYNVSVAWSDKGLVAATCACPAGDDGSVAACSVRVCR
jgi:hypothetical protein